MAYPYSGRAIFSTHNGQYARRQAVPGMRVIIRSSAEKDRDTMRDRLRQKYPEFCKAITTPVTNVDEYFDGYDLEAHGIEFLRAVLESIGSVNAVHTMKVQDYAHRWRAANAATYLGIVSGHAVMDIFTKEDVEEYGHDFLTDTMVYIKHLKAQEDNGSRRDAVRLQTQHDQMIYHRRNTSQSQELDHIPFPRNISGVPAMRASSNPDQGYLPVIPFSHLPAPQRQRHFPFKQIYNLRGGLEHGQPGSTSRGDFEHNSSANRATKSKNSGLQIGTIPVSSQDLPHPLNYRHLSPPTRPVSYPIRKGTCDNKIPKGKKNPIKRSSDDARRKSNTWNSRRPSLGAGGSGWQAVQQAMSMPFYSRSPEAMDPAQGFQVASDSAASSGDNYRSKLLSSFHPGDIHVSTLNPPYDTQAQIQVGTNISTHGRVFSNPFSPSPYSMAQESQDLPFKGVAFPGFDHIGINPEDQSRNQPHSLSLLLKQTHSLQSLDPCAFGYRPSNHQTSSQNHRSVLTFSLKTSHPQNPQTSERFRFQGHPRRQYQEGCRLWISGLPAGMDKAAVLGILEPCRGLNDITEPRVSQNGKDEGFLTWIFADFQNPKDADEALKRLPQTQFDCMPEGHFLRVSYPLFQWSPGHHQRENEYSVERTETIASPSNLHGSEDLDVSLNRPIESESWHYRKQSTNSGHRKKTSSASMDQTVKVTDRSAVDHTEPSNHPSQPGAGYEQPGSTGKDSVQAKAKVRNAVSRDRNANLVGDLTQETASFIKDTSANEETSQRTKPDQIFSKTAKHIRNLKKRSNTFNKLRMPLEKDVTPVEGPPCRENPRSSSQAESGAKHSRLKANASIQSENEQMYGPRTESSSPSIPAAVIASCAAIPKVEAVMNVSFLGTHRQVSEHESEKPTASAPGGVNPRDLEDIRVDLADVTTVTSEDSASVRTLDRSVKRASRARTRGSSSSTLETKDSALPAPYYTDSSSCSETVRSNSIIPESYSGLTLAKDQTLGKPSLATSFDPGKLNEKLKANVEASSFSEDRESPISGPVYAEALRSPEVASNDATSLQEPDLHATTTQKRPTSPVRIKLIEIGNRKVSGGTALNSASGSNTGLAAIEGIQILTPNALSPQSSSAISVDAISKSPECTRAPSIPLRSSSLRMASTTIKTHKKKKPRDFTPSERVLSDNSISSDPKAFILTESTSIGSMPSTGQRSDTLQDLIVDTKAHTVTADQTSNNSNPETTDLLDEVTRLPPHSLSRQSEGRPNQMVMGNRALILSGADQYYLQKKKYKEKHLSSSLQIESTFDNWDLSGSTSTASSTPSTPNKSPNKRKDSLRSKLREAGYGEASSSRHFATEDLDLARVNTMLEKFQPTEGRQDLGDFDDIIVQTVNIEGALRPKMTLGDFVRHRDLILMLEKATFVKRHQASSPTRTRQRKSKSCTNTTIGDRSLEATLSHQLDTISTEDQKSGQVEALLDQSLRHNFMEVSPNKSKTGNGLDHMSIHRSTRMSIASRDDELSQGKQTPEHCIAGRQKPVLVDKPTIQEIADKPKTVNCERDARVPNPSELNASLAVVKCWESEDSRLPSKPCLDIPTWLSSLGQHNPSQERTYLSQSSTSQFVGFDNFSDLMIVFAKMDPIENGNVQPTTETVKNGIRQVDEMDKKKDRLEVADIHTSGVGGESEHKALEGGGNKQPQIGEKVEAINPKATQALQVDVGVREKQDSVKAQEQDFSQVYHSGKTTEPTTPVESENFFRKKAAVKPSQTIPQSDRQEPTRIIVNVKEHELGQSWAIKSRISAGPTPAEAHQIATHTRQNSGASVIDQPAEFEALKELASAQTRVKASYEDHKAATKSTDESPGRSESVNNPHDETNHNRSGDGGSPVKPSNYNMVAKGGGVWKPQVENGVERTGDPWALPTGESPWGTNKQKR